MGFGLSAWIKIFATNVGIFAARSSFKIDPTNSRERIRNHLTQSQVAKRLGFKNLYSYQRLESSKTANPSLLTIALLKSIFFFRD